MDHHTTLEKPLWAFQDGEQDG